MNVDITYDCDVTGDNYNDLFICLEIDETKLSSDKTEDLIGVAFDLFNDHQFPEGIKIHGVTIIGPDIPPVIEEYSWLGKGQVCSKDSCAIKPAFIVSGGNVPTPFDAAVKFNSDSDTAKVHEACFIISGDCYDMPVWALQGSDMYARIQTTDNRDDLTSKMVGKIVTCGNDVPPGSSVNRPEGCKPKECPVVEMDFNVCDLQGGDYITTQLEDKYGLTIGAYSRYGGYTPGGAARVFDSSNPGTNNDNGE